MGCVQGRPSSALSPTRGLEKLKLESGYGKREPPNNNDDDNNYNNNNGDHGSGDNNGGIGVVKKAVYEYDGKSVVKREDERGEKAGKGDGSCNGGNVSKRVMPAPPTIDVAAAEKKLGGDEQVEGWPKWLVDNVSKEAFAGIVPKSADNYDKIAKIGHGTYSNVYKALDRDTGKIVALKKVRFDTSEPESIKFMAREITILQQLDHPNIIKLEGIATSRMQYSLYLVFDFMVSDLTKIICRPGARLTEPQIKCYMQQLLSGLQHCHEKGILHRDIKASNLLIDREGTLKIADFGLANSFKHRPLTSRVVTLWYRAPELLLGSTDYGVGIDLWSAGCLLAEMFLARPFMPGKTEVEQLHRIFKLCGSPSEDYWKKMKLPASFRPPQHYPPSFREIFKDFPASSFGLLTKLLALDPAYRGTVTIALQSEFFTASPPPCDVSGLPVIQIDDATTSNIKSERKRRASRVRHQSRSHRKSVDQTDEIPGLKIEAAAEPSKEEKISNNHSQEVTSSNSFISIQPTMHETARHTALSAALSPVKQLSLKNKNPLSPRTEGHPNASKNIQNYTLLQASVTDIINPNEANGMPQYRRSVSTVDFRYLDPENISKLFGLEN
ncbi:hypothetical protein MLD38_028444 [Melastoma candidum]|uniref:Uncharacterized protein n=1 Tax=Melastoma candidum TaxID=119954 RepID=A0ACB9N3E2_9MYRT|nr:hypothetical protein MLD38_028444 [Melastoma candidum]